MQQLLRASWEPLLEALMKIQRPAALHEISDAVQLSPPTALRHLQAMEDAGFITRTGNRKQARYAAAERVYIDWVTRWGDRWARLEWQGRPPQNWEFPLVSRIPDGLAQNTLQRFLEEMQDAHILHPWLFWQRIMHNLDKHPDIRALREAVPDDLRERWKSALTNRRGQGAPTAIVYGSCATGQARDESDVDVLIITPPRDGLDPPGFTTDEWKAVTEQVYDHAPSQFHKPLPEIDYKWEVADIVDRLNLGAARILDVQVVAEDDTPLMPEALQQAIVNEGKTIFPGQWGLVEFLPEGSLLAG